MTILKIKQVPAAYKNKTKRKIYLRCDWCEKEFICEERYKFRALKQELHFCSRKCVREDRQNGGKLKIKQTKTMIEKYGAPSFFHTDEFKKQQIIQCLEQYGVESRLEAPEILEKIKQTNLAKYGRETYVGSEDHLSKIDHKDIARKAWETKIKNGTCQKSGPEETLNDLLVKIFGQESIKRQIFMIRQWIDFWVAPLSLYIQVDGVYWHGLNRPLKEIKKQKTSQDKNIYEQVLRDRKLNKHMKKNNMKLLRITDEQIKSAPALNILEMILLAGGK